MVNMNKYEFEIFAEEWLYCFRLYTISNKDKKITLNININCNFYDDDYIYNYCIIYTKLNFIYNNKEPLKIDIIIPDIYTMFEHKLLC